MHLGRKCEGFYLIDMLNQVSIENLNKNMIPF